MKTTSKSDAKLEQGYVKMPLLILSKKEFDAKTAHLKQKPGTALDLGDVRDPSTPLVLAKTVGKGGGPVASPKRRRHAVCVVYGPEELDLIFGIQSEYGGMVCTRH